MDLMTDLPLTSLIFVLIPVLIALMALPWREEERQEVHLAAMTLGRLVRVACHTGLAFGQTVVVGTVGAVAGLERKGFGPGTGGARDSQLPVAHLS